jgi:broad specificity phosphatase PhoE
MNAIATAHKVDTYAGLLLQIRDDLRLQHPEWIQPNGESPMCDSYEARLIEILDASIRRQSNNDVVAVSHIPPCRMRKIC